MSKMRINELARELEVKPGVILELLPTLGVHGKTTHSHTIDAEVADMVRKRLAAPGESQDSGSRPISDKPSIAESDAPAKESREEVKTARAAVSAPTGVKPHVTEATKTPEAGQPAPRPPAAELSKTSSPSATGRPATAAGSPPQASQRDQSSAVSEQPKVHAAAARGGEPTPPAPAPAPGQRPQTKTEIRKSVPTFSPPLASPGKDRPIAPPLPPSLPPPLRRASSPITPPLAGAAEAEHEPARRPVGASSLLPPPLRARPVGAKHSLFRHDEEKEAGAETTVADEVTAKPAEPRPAVPTLPEPIAPVVPGPPVSPAPPTAGAAEEQRTAAEQLQTAEARADRARVPSAAIPGAPLSPEHRRTPAPRSTPAPPMPTAPEAQAARPDLPRPAAPRPGEILRSMPAQSATLGTTPPTKVVAPGQAIPGLKPGEPIAGSETVRRLRGAESALRPAPGPARPPVPNRPGAVSRPTARPVVPPTPEMVERLKQIRPGAATQRPGAPRPRPGEPIYAGPMRPGPQLDRARIPGRPSPGSGYTARGRGMHPTSAPLLPDVAPPPAAPGRKPAGGKRAADRGRRQEFEEKELAFRPVRRREPEAPPPITREITVAEGITVKELSEKLDVKASLIIKKLLDRKVFATINQTLDAKLAEEMARAFGASIKQMSYEQESVQEIADAEVEGDLEERPPVVTIMGHVDHGKTSLLDAIRATNVAAREAGGITQHIGAYYVEKNNKKIVFVDTPGHSAFTRMRARGAKVTDIVVLVVAADDGIMPQTDEAINHAKAAGVPIIVAINKIDKPSINLERVKQQLTERGLMPEDWGGDTVTVPVSAKAGTNIDLLLEMILLSAEILELKANPARPARATVLEAQLDKGRGPVATVIVRDGTLRAGDHYICGSVFGRVRAMFDDRGNSVSEAGPSMPVEVLGLESVPEVGDTLQVVTDTAKAKQIALYRESKARDVQMAKSSKITLERFHTTLREGEIKELLIVLKADVGGTAEVVAETLEKLSNDKVRLRVILSGVGAINESDVLLASASNAIVVGFNVRPDKNAIALAERESVDIRLHTIIYELTDEVKAAMSGMLEPVYKEVFRGRAEVKEAFRITKVGTIAGCLVVEGAITRDSQVRLLRDNTVVFTGRISSLKRFKDDASEVRANLECGIGIENYNDIKPGDVIEAFVRERVQVEAFA
ncbi:MAG: translation initiation factor IF-2 [Bryobacterales bacterium]|nr:translation initiation factor IF-2 [Bryobacterales bacterium]